VKPGLLATHEYATRKCFAEGDINGNAEMAPQFDKAYVNRSTSTGKKYLTLHFKIHVDEATKFALNL